MYLEVVNTTQKLENISEVSSNYQATTKGTQTHANHREMTMSIQFHIKKTKKNKKKT